MLSSCLVSVIWGSSFQQQNVRGFRRVRVRVKARVRESVSAAVPAPPGCPALPPPPRGLTRSPARPDTCRGLAIQTHAAFMAFVNINLQTIFLSLPSSRCRCGQAAPHYLSFLRRRICTFPYAPHNTWAAGNLDIKEKVLATCIPQRRRTVNYEIEYI